MRAAIVRPTGVERTFDPGSFLVSKTDPKGVITYANGLFLEVAAYSEEQVLGRPHNLIRHPDMPRCVFQLLWDRLNNGREVFAYVLNLAGDGAHYWVFAHVTPSFDRTGRIVGHHSNRRATDPGAVREIQPLYGRLLAEEKQHSRPSEAMAGSSALLDKILADGSHSYDEFVWSLAGRTAQATR